MDGGLILTIQIISSAFIGLLLFWVKDIKDDLKQANSNFLTHASSLQIHCSKEKFQLLHIPQKG
jgi:hypothetical protein